MQSVEAWHRPHPGPSPVQTARAAAWSGAEVVLGAYTHVDPRRMPGQPQSASSLSLHVGGQQPSGVIEQGGAVPPAHVPEMQTVSDVHAIPSSHGMPSFVGTATQLPSAGLHIPTEHCEFSDEQSVGVLPPPHTPAVQTLSAMHGLAGSMHGMPSFVFMSSQAPVVGLQYASWHSFGTGVEEQSMRVPPVHRPSSHTVPVTHRSGYSHGVPFSAGDPSARQVSATGSHTTS